MAKYAVVTPKEYSSGNSRYLGRICAARLQGGRERRREVCGVRRWALANTLARTCYATLRDKEPFGEPTVRLGKRSTGRAL